MAGQVPRTNTSPPKATRRKRKAPARRVPHVIEERPRTPFLFGRGAHLSQRERDSLKERIALFAGIAIGVVVAAIIGYGVLYDNVIRPSQVQAANNVPIASVGNSFIRTGFFKRFEKFRSTSISNQLTQLQQQQASLNSQPKKSSSQTQQAAQLTQQISQLQASQGTLAADSLNELIDNQIAIQRGYTLGVKPSAAAQKAADQQLIQQVGGPRHFLQFIQTSGLSATEVKTLLLGEYLQGKIQPKVIARVASSQTEVRASHILIPTSKHALALQLYHRVLKGASFAALALKYSIDPGSKKKGGNLGYFPRGQNVPAFDKAAFSMKIGQVRLVHITYGWSILKVTGRKYKKLTAAQLQQAKSGAFQNWITSQKAVLQVQNYVAASQLPGIATPTALPIQQPAVGPTLPVAPAQTAIAKVPHRTVPIQKRPTAVAPSSHAKH